MAETFLDTSFAIALTVTSDRHHERARLLASRIRDDRSVLVTTHGVLAEIGDAFSREPYRISAVRLLQSLLRDPNVVILAITPERFAAGFQLFMERTDKTWGLTDCISFVVMRERGITEALTADRHFQQAGYSALLSEGAG